MARKRPLLTDDQWALIEPLLPQPKPSPKGGRKPIDNRRVLEGILWILRTGARWKDLPDEYPSPSTCWRRLRDWEEQDVWVNVWRTFLADLDEAGWLEWDEAYDYDNYGMPLVDATRQPLTASALGNPCFFTGRRWHPELGLYNYRTRWYDPASGRFTTRDTIGIWGDANNLGNAFAYVGNNPWTHVDPSGRLPAVLVGMAADVGLHVLIGAAVGTAKAVYENYEAHGWNTATWDKGEIAKGAYVGAWAGLGAGLREVTWVGGKRAN